MGDANPDLSVLDIPQSTQLVIRPGIIELTWGQPDPDLLPVEQVGRAATAMLNQIGRDALSYGASAGSGPLIAWLRDRIRRTESQPITAEEIVITAGNSDAIDHLSTLFTKPGEVVLVESPSYHLALRILRDHGLELVPIPVDEEGLRVDLARQKIQDYKQTGRRVQALYTIPTFHNPTGVSLSAERRQTLVDLAQAEQFFILEDDVYRELAYDSSAAPPSLWSLAPRGTVFRLGSFAKSLAPGLRLGWINASATQIERIVNAGLRDSGGGVNHFAAMAVGHLCETGDFDRQVEYFKTNYRQRRDALLEALAEYLPAGCTWTKPGGGFFVWVTLPEGMDTAALIAQAEAAGVAFLPGQRFCLDGRGQNSLRLSFCLYPPAELVKGAERLGRAVRQALTLRT